MEFSKMTYKEALCAAELPKLAVDATKYAEDIKKAYLGSPQTSSSTDEKIIIISNEEMEMFIRGGVWKYRVDGEWYIISCTPEGIFKHLQDEFLAKHGFKEVDRNFHRKNRVFHAFLHRASIDAQLRK